MISSGFCAPYNSAISIIRSNASRRVVWASALLEVHYRSVFCFVSTMEMDGPLYSTGFAMIALAVQRFILVKRPFTAQQTLSKRYYLISGAICTVLSLVLILSSSLVTVFLNKDVCRETSFYNNKQLRAIADSMIFYIVPVICCLYLYISVGIELWKKETQVARNTDLTILFLTSCFTWIVPWFPTILYLLLFQSIEYTADVFNNEPSILFLYIWHAPFFHLFSALNPIIFFLCYKPSQSPLKAISHRDGPT